MRKSFFLVIGGFSLTLAILGVFLPLLPTTPFLLLSVYCFERGSERIHNLLLAHSVLGPPIHNWKEKKIIRPKVKLLAISMIFASAIYISIFSSMPILGQYVLFLILASVSTFILCQKSK